MKIKSYYEITYQQAIKEARELPTHIDGKLQPHYKMYSDETSFKIHYGSSYTPASVFMAMCYKRNCAQGYFLQKVPTYREDGSLKKMREWETKMFFHKPWGIEDVKVKDVTFDIVGIKRKTTHLPAGVLITNIKFIH